MVRGYPPQTLYRVRAAKEKIMDPKTLRQWAGLVPISSIEPAKTAMLLIDFQMDYFTPGKLEIPDGDRAVRRADALRKWAREKGIKVVHIRQLSKPASPIFAQGSRGVEFNTTVAPEDGETIIAKTLPSSFQGTELREWLDSHKIDTLIVTGLMTHMCVETTARDAAQMGYRVIVVSDATASRDLPTLDGRSVMTHGEVHAAALDRHGRSFRRCYGIR